jgi:hypothetical protein
MSPVPADADAELKRIGHALRPLDIVLVNTSAGAKYGGRAPSRSSNRVGLEIVVFRGKFSTKCFGRAYRESLHAAARERFTIPVCDFFTG